MAIVVTPNSKKGPKKRSYVLFVRGISVFGDVLFVESYVSI